MRITAAVMTRLTQTHPIPLGGSSEFVGVGVGRRPKMAPKPLSLRLDE